VLDGRKEPEHDGIEERRLSRLMRCPTRGSTHSAASGIVALRNRLGSRHWSVFVAGDEQRRHVQAAQGVGEVPKRRRAASNSRSVIAIPAAECSAS
jgi:hypothetical protein